MAATVSLDAFLHGIRSAAVVDPGQLEALVNRLSCKGAMPGTAEELAALLVSEGFLTRFQSQQFLTNRWSGLTLGKYQVLERLGRGANGSVYLCKHQAMGRTVAIKVLPPMEVGGHAARLRFEREARAGAAVDHPNIIHVFDFDHEGDVSYLVMEYVQGVNLYELPLRVGPLAVERAVHYIRQAALGLQAIHQAGLIHRDIKPANMLLDANGTVKILDLGLARFSDDDEDQLTMQHDARRVLGTADYLAPEQALNSHAVDIRADIYGLGGSLYFLLTAKPPYGDGATVQKLVWAQTKPPIPITSLRPDLPPALVAVIERLLAKNPDDRCATPAEVADVLAPWAQGLAPRPTADELTRDKENLDGLSIRDLSNSSPSGTGAVSATAAQARTGPGASTVSPAAAMTESPVKGGDAKTPVAQTRPAALGSKSEVGSGQPRPTRSAPDTVPAPPKVGRPEVVASISMPSRSGNKPSNKPTVVVPRGAVPQVPPAENGLSSAGAAAPAVPTPLARPQRKHGKHRSSTRKRIVPKTQSGSKESPSPKQEPSPRQASSPKQEPSVKQDPQSVETEKLYSGPAVSRWHLFLANPRVVAISLAATTTGLILVGLLVRSYLK